MKKYTGKCKLWELDPGGYHLVIPAKLHGQTVLLLIDTGANHTCFNKSFIDSLETGDAVTGKDDVHVGIGGQDFIAYITTVSDLKIARKKIPAFSCRLLDLQHVNEAYEMAGFPAIHGVLGGDFLQKYGAVIDYANRTLTFTMEN